MKCQMSRVDPVNVDPVNFMFINFNWLKILTLSVTLAFLPAQLFGSSTSVNKSELKNSDAIVKMNQQSQTEWDWEEFCNMGAEYCCDQLQTQATTDSSSSPENPVISNQKSPKTSLKKLSKHEKGALSKILNSLGEAAQKEEDADIRVADAQSSAAIEAACNDWEAIGKSHLPEDDRWITVCTICGY